MINEIPGLDPLPSATTTVWRYMGFSKFVSLLETGALWFARADTFEDTHEGLLPLKTRQEWANLSKWLSGQRAKTYVSCWHSNDYESVGMWKAYLGGEPGVVVETDIGKLKASLSSYPEVIYFGAVKYIDFTKDELEGWQRSPNILHPIMHKRRFFAYEREIRAVINTMSDTSLQAANKGEMGIPVSVNLSDLIRRVRTATGSGGWFVRLVEAVVKRYGLSVPVIRSEIDELPAT
jgi:hypothetical protein